ncbi:MAG: hypothetical protein WC460_03385 [Patescibacteria group bacterium]
MFIGGLIWAIKAYLFFALICLVVYVASEYLALVIRHKNYKYYDPPRLEDIKFSIKRNFKKSLLWPKRLFKRTRALN